MALQYMRLFPLVNNRLDARDRVGMTLLPMCMSINLIMEACFESVNVTSIMDVNGGTVAAEQDIASAETQGSLAVSSAATAALHDVESAATTPVTGECPAS